MEIFKHPRPAEKRSLRRRLRRGGMAAGILFLALAIAFVCRRPVVLVQDEPFVLVYGEKRARLARLGLSVRLFRRIKTVSIAEGAGPDLAAQAALGLSARPRGVFFPYRYREGARRYLLERPGVPAAILAGRNRPEQAPDGVYGQSPGQKSAEPVWIYTDTTADLYRAGACAAIAARDGQSAPESGDPGAGSPQASAGDPQKAVALCRNRLDDAEKNAFRRGLEDRGWTGAVRFLTASEVLPGPGGDLACAVLAGGDFINDGKTPLVFFSWADPVLFPRNGAAVFDDSPWAQLGPALKLLEKGESGAVPSKITALALGRRLNLVSLEIKRLKTLKYEPGNADN